MRNYLRKKFNFMRKYRSSHQCGKDIRCFTRLLCWVRKMRLKEAKESPIRRSQRMKAEGKAVGKLGRQNIKFINKTKKENHVNENDK